MRSRNGWIVFLLVSIGSPVALAADALVPGFAVEPYTAGLHFPLAMEFAPDGRLFVAEKAGVVRIVENGVVRAEPFCTESVYAQFECGLLGLALDPDFAANHYVYLFETVSNQEQIIVRFREEAGRGRDRTVIRDHLPTGGTIHNGGCLKVGADRKLYFAIGDNSMREQAQDITSLAGKVCRINLDGTTPDDNPFMTPTGSPRAIFALGFRNPFRFCFAPDGRLFVLDVGSDHAQRREEINLVRAADNCGWPEVEGVSDPVSMPQYRSPLFAYHDEGSAPAGAVVYSGSQFPAEYVGNLFHLEYTLNRLYRTVLDGETVVSHTTFVQGESGPVDLAQGPDGSLYYCELFSGEIKRIRYLGDDAPADPPADPPPWAVLCGQGLWQWIFAAMAVPGFRRGRRGRQKAAARAAG